VSLLSIVIALHMCYILLSIALSLFLLGNTTARSRVLRGATTLLQLLSTIKLVALGSVSSCNKYSIREGNPFRRSSTISRCFKITSKVVMCHNELKAPPMITIIWESLNHIQDLLLLRDFSPSNLKISNHDTHGS